MPETRVERCEYCDDGWVESHPSPTPSGPHYTYSRCRDCDGNGNVEIHLSPIEQEDLPE